MKLFFVLIAVLLVSIIDAAPKPTTSPKQTKPTVHSLTKRVQHNAPLTAKSAPKNADKRKRQIPYFIPGPNYYPQPAAPFADFQSALQAAFLSGVHFSELEKSLKNHNLTDASGKASLSPEDAKALAAFETGFGANSFDAKALKPDSAAPSVKSEKLGDVNSSVVALVDPYRSSHVNALFGPELAPRFEIHYSPSQGLTLDALPPFAGAGIHGAVGPAFESVPYGPEVGPYPGFGIAPGFNQYPYPYPFLPGFDPKGLKPNGKGDDKKPEKTEGPTEASPSNPEGPSSEAAPSDSPASESPSSEAPQ